MALTARVPSGAVTNLFLPKIYSRRVEEGAKSELVCWAAINSEWRKDLSKGDTLYIPKSNTVTATEVVVDTRAASTNPFNTGGVTLSIDKFFQAPVDIDTMTRWQSQVDMETYAVTESTYAIDVQVDTSVAALFASLNNSVVYGSDGQTLVSDIIEALKETLDEANVPMVIADRSLILDPSGLADMAKIDKYITEEYARKGLVANGVMGQSPIAGCMVRVTNNLAAATTGNYAVMLHRRAIGGAIQFQNPWREERKDLHTLRYQVEALWGVVEVRDDWGISFYSRKS